MMHDDTVIPESIWTLTPRLKCMNKNILFKIQKIQNKKLMLELFFRTNYYFISVQMLVCLNNIMYCFIGNTLQYGLLMMLVKALGIIN